MSALLRNVDRHHEDLLHPDRDGLPPHVVDGEMRPRLALLPSHHNNFIPRRATRCFAQAAIIESVKPPRDLVEITLRHAHLLQAHHVRRLLHLSELRHQLPHVHLPICIEHAKLEMVFLRPFLSCPRSRPRSWIRLDALLDQVSPSSFFSNACLASHKYPEHQPRRPRHASANSIHGSRNRIRQRSCTTTGFQNADGRPMTDLPNHLMGHAPTD